MAQTVGTSPTGLRINVRGFLRRKRGPDILRAIERGMLKGAKRSIPVIRTFTPKFRGFLMRSYGVNFRKNPRRALVVSSSPPEKVAAMELGRRPGSMPPVAPLLQWVRSKFRLRNPQRVRSAAFAVAKNMKRFGIKVPLKVTGKGAMFSRTVQKLGANFYSKIVTREIGKLR